MQNIINPESQMINEHNSFSSKKVLIQHQQTQQTDQIFNPQNAYLICIYCDNIDLSYAQFCSKCFRPYVQQTRVSCQKCNLLMVDNKCLNCDQSLEIICKSCSYKNLIYNEKCQVCGQALKLQKLKQFNKTVCKICQKSSQNNNSVNQICYECNQLIQKQKWMCMFCTSPNLISSSECFMCKNSIPLICKNCFKKNSNRDKCQQCHSQLKIEVSKKFCENCFCEIENNRYLQHQINCDNIFKPENQSLLTDIQLECLDTIQRQAQKSHKIANQTFHLRLQQLGLQNQQINQLQRYIEKSAPLIIHINLRLYLQKYINDTHYRNSFETNSGAGARNKQYRIQKENQMFYKHYQNASDFQRVKYGVINITNDIRGVISCQSYGKSYFLLGNQLRDRVTITNGNSNNRSKIGTLKYCNHILNQLTDEELMEARLASKFQQVGKYNSYKEIQIHGPISFYNDIQIIYVHPDEADQKILGLLDIFKIQFRVDYQIIKT